MTLIMESSNDIGAGNFNKMKEFAKQLIDAFVISDFGTRVAAVTYGNTAVLNFKLNSIPGVNQRQVFNEIDNIPFQGGAGGGVSAALEQAVNSIYTKEGGSRDSSNKVIPSCLLALPSV